MLAPAVVVIWAGALPFLALAFLGFVNTVRQLVEHRQEHRLRSRRSNPDRLGSLRLFSAEERRSLEQPRLKWRSRLTPDPWSGAGGLSLGELTNYANLLKDRRLAWDLAVESVLLGAAAVLGAWVGPLYANINTIMDDSNLHLRVGGVILFIVIVFALSARQSVLPRLRASEMKFHRLRRDAESLVGVSPNADAGERLTLREREHLAAMLQWSRDGGDV